MKREVLVFLAKPQGDPKKGRAEQGVGASSEENGTLQLKILQTEGNQSILIIFLTKTPEKIIILFNE